MLSKSKFLIEKLNRASLAAGGRGRFSAMHRPIQSVNKPFGSQPAAAFSSTNRNEDHRRENPENEGVSFLSPFESPND